MARNPGRHGLRALNRLLGDYLPVDGSREGLERDFQRLLEREGFPPPIRNVLVLGELVDCWWPAAPFAVELDSRGFHRTWAQQERDRVRDAKFLRAGIPLLRVTDRRIKAERGELILDLASKLARTNR